MSELAEGIRILLNMLGRVAPPEQQRPEVNITERVTVVSKEPLSPLEAKICLAQIKAIKERECSK
jgi:hypothetical protein